MNPIVLVVAWFVINLFLKSAKEKRKIEEAKRKRESQLGNQPKNVQNTVDTSRETLRKELQRAMAAKTNKATPPKAPERPIPQPRPSLEAVKPRNTVDWNIKKEEMLAKAKPVSKPMEGNGVKIDIKKDLVRGIIFSEILSPPKSMINQKRSV